MSSKRRNRHLFFEMSYTWVRASPMELINFPYIFRPLSKRGGSIAVARLLIDTIANEGGHD